MMTKQPLFPLADTSDVDLEQAGGKNVAVDETFATAERIQLASRNVWVPARTSKYCARPFHYLIPRCGACFGLAALPTGM
jgi:hypothetical protein